MPEFLDVTLYSNDKDIEKFIFAAVKSDVNIEELVKTDRFE